jgi:hypothetical protein
MHNGRRVLLVFLQLYVQIIICVVNLTLIILVACRYSFTPSIQKLPDSVVKSVSRVSHSQGRVAPNDLVIDQFEFSC